MIMARGIAYMIVTEIMVEFLRNGSGPGRPAERDLDRLMRNSRMSLGITLRPETGCKQQTRFMI